MTADSQSPLRKDLALEPEMHQPEGTVDDVDNIWSIYIDIDGFSPLWSDKVRVVSALGDLMTGVFRLGTICYPEPPERLFAYQLGDGFLIASDFHESSLERCLVIAVALMRHVAPSGCFARAAIAEGDLADIQGCYPREVMNHCDGGHRVYLGGGILVVAPVMGSALIAAVGVDKRAPRGPLLTVEADNVPRLGPGVATHPMAEGKLAAVDWVHLDWKQLAVIQAQAGLTAPSPDDLDQMLVRYCAEESVPEDWRASVKDLLGVSV